VRPSLLAALLLAVFLFTGSGDFEEELEREAQHQSRECAQVVTEEPGWRRQCGYEHKEGIRT
jgi:hypothetical protein